MTYFFTGANLEVTPKEKRLSMELFDGDKHPEAVLDLTADEAGKLAVRLSEWVEAQLPRYVLSPESRTGLCGILDRTTGKEVAWAHTDETAQTIANLMNAEEDDA